LKHLLCHLGPHDSAAVVILGDLHVGDTFARERFFALRAWLLAAPNRFCAVNGDILNAATSAGPELPTEQRERTTAQIVEARDLFRPLVQAPGPGATVEVSGGRRTVHPGRLLAWNDGNHERRLVKAADIIPGQLLCEMLEVPEIYGGVDAGDYGYTVHLDLRVGANRHGRPNGYRALLCHGWGGGRTVGAALNKVAEMQSVYPNCDFYAQSHAHGAGVIERAEWRYDERTHRGRLRPYWLIVTAAVSEWGGFEESRMFRPGGAAMPYLAVGGGEEWAEVAWLGKREGVRAA
jgi:hypothetical protein